MSHRKVMRWIGLVSVVASPGRATLAANPLEAWVSRYAEIERSPSRTGPFEFSIAVDPEGNVVVSGTTVHPETIEDYTTVKYDRDGKELWTRRFNGLGGGVAKSIELTRAMAIDDDGNIYVTGTSAGVGAGVIVKYHPDGSLLWVRNSPSFPVAITVDSAGSAHVAGRGDTVKYSPDGEPLWTLPHQFTARTMKLDPRGNVYLGGHSIRNSIDFATVKCGPDGQLLWQAAHDGTGRSQDQVEAIAVDGEGNVYASGTSLSPTGRADYATVKYDSQGSEVWVRRYKGEGWENRVSSLALDGAGNIIVTGTSGSDTGSNLTTIKYSPEGGETWVSRVDTAGQPKAMAVDGDGAVFITGRSASRRDWAYTTVRLEADGNTSWVMYTDGPAGDDDALSLALGPDGAVHVTGSSLGAGGTFDIMTVKYVPGPDLPARRFIRGDSNASGAVDILDPVTALGHLFLGEEATSCRKALDANDDGTVNIADPIHLLTFLFIGGAEIPAPGRSCGEDPTPDGLSCNGHAPCP